MATKKKVSKKKAKKGTAGLKKVKGQGNKGMYENSLVSQLYKAMKNHPSQLYNVQSNLAVLRDYQNPGSLFYQLHKKGMIHLSKHRTETGGKQYAINLPEEDRLTNEILTPAEVRAIIAPIINKIGKIVDMQSELMALLPALKEVEVLAVNASEIVNEAEKKLEQAKRFFGD